MTITESLKKFFLLYMPILKIWQLYVLLCTSLCCQFIIYYVGLLPSKLTKCLVDKNFDDFQVTVVIALLLLILNAGAISLVKSEFKLEFSILAQVIEHKYKKITKKKS